MNQIKFLVSTITFFTENPDSYEGPSSPMFAKSNAFGIGRDAVSEVRNMIKVQYKPEISTPVRLY